MKIQGVIFDWAGTLIDFGSFAPMGAFVEAFAAFQVKVTIDEARAPMGMAKRDHIKTMVEMERIANEWEKVRGLKPTEQDIDAIYEVFVPLNEKVAAKYATLVPGALEVFSYLRKRGLKIGTTTGYARSIMENVLPVVKKQGFEPETLVCSDDLKQGRPGPLGMYQCCVDLGIHPVTALIKVDDTVPGIEEGVSAGCMTIGVALSGNYAGKTWEELVVLSDEEKDLLIKPATEKLKAAGAHYIIDTIADLPDLLDEIL